MSSGKELVSNCRDTTEELRPFFEQLYDIELPTPDFSSTEGGFQKAPMRYSRGMIKVREDHNWSKYSLDHYTAHELGHHALYENSDIDQLWQDTDYRSLNLSTIDEAVAITFGAEGVRELYRQARNQGDWKDVLGYRKRLIGHRIGYGLDRIIPNKRVQYREGRKLAKDKDLGAIIVDPDQVYQELREFD